MNISGLDKFSLNEYPGKPCIIVFTQGCNYQCPFCYNPKLVVPRLFGKPISEEEVLKFLELRRPSTDAIVVTGGEPLIQEGLLEFLKKVKQLNYSIKINTNGSVSAKLEQLINEKLVDYIQMDIKAPWQKYNMLTGSNLANNEREIKRSINLVETSKLPHEFRTTYFKFMLDDNDIKEIKSYVKHSKHIINEFVEPSF